MILWGLLTVLCCAVCVAISIPLIRRYESADDARTHLSVYQSQLAEIERDEKSGQITPPEAAAAKAEVQRRMLAAARAEEVAGSRLSPAMQNILVFATGLFVALGGVYLYSQIGRPDLAQVQPVQTPAPANATSGTPTVDTVDNKISELEARMQANPNDAQGWRMLGWAYFSMGRYDKSVSAYEKALGLSPADVDVKSALAEAQVMASGNVVTPKAKATFEEVLRTNPKDDRSRFYLALAMEQSGNAAGALDSWLALFADAPADAGWIGEVRSHIESLGKQLGKDVSAQLAAKTPAVTPPGPETNPEAAAAIQQMPAGDQQEMIKGMVQRLADRLKANPKDVEGWKRLIRARVVLNDPVGAKQALADGNAAFGDEPATQQMLKDAAAADGISLD